MRRRLLFLVPCVVSLAATLGGCSGDDDAAPDLAAVTGVPAAWIADTGAGWPESAGFGGAIPVLGSGTCLLGDEPPEILGERGRFTDQGFGGFGADRSATDQYRYLCELWDEDEYAGSLQLMRVADDATGRQLMATFDAQTSTSQQDNTVTHETSGQVSVSVLARTYPTNPDNGEYIAQYYDASGGAVVTLEINSLDAEQRDELSAQQAADALVAAMAEGA
ncbi:hypothetical protein [Luteimicrobium subarcticum]|uniref:PknH-like protein n=1 Tax=Luteimicrobium subarcticum TaxID=620910 RepID=A0A2M8WW25_9MICO|nr:hypothetical protein [Luteimicrobium subarcticum]PJI95120.1 hypothetical protein CLV34_0974 [Luteimicrobium subarcticum]